MTTLQHSFERVDHIQLAIPVGGEYESRVFWGELLGLAEARVPSALEARVRWFDGPGFQVHLGIDPEFRPALKAHPAFQIHGIRALAERLVAAGHAVTWSDDVPGRERFHTADPFGNRLEFLELQ